ncbi:MAG: sodium:dicarboxylate symporter, partial [Frankiales bacterium]|nr:sodium:dicarboxylate symporter [Frankiales bacterium]
MPVTRTASGPARTGSKPIHKTLYFWVLIGIVAGAVVGAVSPDLGIALEPVGVSFVNLIKMVIAPIIFCTVVTGIASMDSMKSVGRVGGKALIYFEVLTTAALVIGLVVVNVAKPGAGINADPKTIEVSEKVGGLIEQGEASHWYDFIFHIFPSSMVGAFAEGDVLQVLFIAIVFAFALHSLGERGRVITRGVESFGQALFGMVRIVMYAAPVGAFGAMAFTIGKYGLDTLTNLAQLVLTFYVTALIFVLVVLGGVLRACGINVFSFLRYFKSELLVVLGTSSSESVLPQLMRKLEHLGCSKPVVGLTVPAGYSFNLDGTCIYLTLASIFVAQAQGVDLGIGQQLAIVAVLMLTSKGAAGVTGSGFVVLAATLSTLGTIPVAGIMLVFGVDKFMSECRALTNMCGNAVASVVVSKWEGQFDADRARRVLAGEEVFELDLLVDEDALVTERIDEEELALLGAASAPAPVGATAPRLDARGLSQQDSHALLMSDLHEAPGRHDLPQQQESGAQQVRRRRSATPAPTAPVDRDLAPARAAT